ncbi:lysozyme [Streptomyces sp. HUAS MG91]|uniref:lysozyme n=1 Tax=Streptomyces tabacisoli TaxID=3156398 RepID=A0AAU8IPH9_9ACTN
MARDSKPSRRRALLLATVTVTALTMGSTVLAELPVQAATRPKGHDVSSHQKNVDWSKTKRKGARFTYVKATESTTYKNPYFWKQYDGARNAGIIRGAYHFAVPDQSSGRTQAAYFVRNGGDWRGDGWTLPPALDIEFNPYSKHKCYGMSKGKLVSWISSFSAEVQRLTGRHPVIYTNYHWWKTCTGNSGAFSVDHALWLARYDESAGSLPKGWSFWTFWQYDNSGGLPGDQNLFNGSMAQLRRFALG